MRIAIERDPARMRVQVYVATKLEEDGEMLDHFLVHAPDNPQGAHAMWKAFPPGSRPEPFLDIEEDLWTMIESKVREDRVGDGELTRLAAHCADAVAVRDRLLAMVEAS